MRLPLKRNIYFIKKNEAGAWVSGSIVSDRSAPVVTFVEDHQVTISTHTFAHTRGQQQLEKDGQRRTHRFVWSEVEKLIF